MVDLPMIKTTSLVVIISLSLVLYQKGHARTFKCIDENGNVLYSQKACKNNQKTDKVIGKKRSYPKNPDCKYARRFAATVAREMRAGADAHQTFSRYGGINSLSKGPVNIINYVYSYRNSNKMSSQRIAALTQTKCNAKSFGDLKCDDLPFEFTSRIGGCEPKIGREFGPSRDPSIELQEQEALEGKAKLRAKESKIRASKEAKRRERRLKEKCKERYERRLANIDDKMRQGYSSKVGERLRVERRDLRKSMREDCR